MRSLFSYIAQAQQSEETMRTFLEHMNKTGKVICQCPPDSFEWTGDVEEFKTLLKEWEEQHE